MNRGRGASIPPPRAQSQQQSNANATGYQHAHGQKQCFKCGGVGHIRRDCPSNEQVDPATVMMAMEQFANSFEQEPMEDGQYEEAVEEFTQEDF